MRHMISAYLGKECELLKLVAASFLQKKNFDTIEDYIRIFRVVTTFADELAIYSAACMLGIHVVILTDSGAWTTQDTLSVDDADVVMAYGGEFLYHLTEVLPEGEGIGRTRSENRPLDPSQASQVHQVQPRSPPPITRTAVKAAAAAGSIHQVAKEAMTDVTVEKKTFTFQKV
jgi:hypothetical protein